jgi:hypothetical protein
MRQSSNIDKDALGLEVLFARTVERRILSDCIEDDIELRLGRRVVGDEVGDEGCLVVVDRGGGCERRDEGGG